MGHWDLDSHCTMSRGATSVTRLMSCSCARSEVVTGGVLKRVLSRGVVMRRRGLGVWSHECRRLRTGASRSSATQRDQRRTSLEKLAQARRRSQQHRSPQPAPDSASGSAVPDNAADNTSDAEHTGDHGTEGRVSRDSSRKRNRTFPDEHLRRTKRHNQLSSDSAEESNSDSWTPGGVLDAGTTHAHRGSTQRSRGKMDPRGVSRIT